MRGNRLPIRVAAGRKDGRKEDEWHSGKQCSSKLCAVVHPCRLTARVHSDGQPARSGEPVHASEPPLVDRSVGSIEDQPSIGHGLAARHCCSYSAEQ
jgi:hypothetical protein